MNDPALRSPPAAVLRARLAQWARRRRWPLLLVGAPTLLAAAYYFVIAADLYASEARFVVRSPSRVQVSGLMGFLQGQGVASSQSEVYAVHDFILSRDALAALQQKVNLREVFGRPEGDFLARYPSLVDRDDGEDFYRHYQRRVDVVFDTTTGLCTLTVKAFRPDDAQRVARQVLDEAEALINRLNDRSRSNAIKDAEDQVRLAEVSVTQAQQNMLAFRERETLIDPGKSSGAMFEQLTKIQADLSTSRARLAELDRSSPGSPLRTDLETHIGTLERQAAEQRERLAGGDRSMAPKISEYDQLALRQEFAAKELTSALSSLETARAEARRQQVYLDRVVDAGLPDKALYPRRVESVLVVFVSCFLVYSIGALLLAGVREHAQD